MTFQWAELGNMDEVKIGADMRGNERATGARGVYGSLFTTYQNVLEGGLDSSHFTLCIISVCFLIFLACVYICY